jgi:thiol:disulfide interchange protein DsbD
MTGLGDALQHQPLLAVPLLFGAGVATSLTPCIYPMIPITAGLLAGSARAEASRWRAATLALTYALGLATLYALTGLLAGMSGQLFGAVASNPWVRFATGNLLLLFGLAMLDVFPISAPQRLMAWASQLGGGSYGSVLLLGATSGIVAAPCGAPAFAAVLTWVAATKSGALGFLYLFAFSLGMSAILILVGTFAGALAALPRAGPWMVWIKKAGGAVLLAMAEYYFVEMGRVL